MKTEFSKRKATPKGFYMYLGEKKIGKNFEEQCRHLTTESLISLYYGGGSCRQSIIWSELRNRKELNECLTNHLNEYTI